MSESSVSAPTKHYVSYHNAEKMGYSFEDSDVFSVGTKKPVDRLIGCKIWSLAGIGKPRKYFLGACFIVDDVGPSTQLQFANYARGSVGTVFNPLVALSDLPWFPDFLKSQNHFSLGLQPIQQKFVANLEALAPDPIQNPIPSSLFPDEVDSAENYREGSVRRVTVNAYERNDAARQRCIDHYKPTCFICGFDFGNTYGLIVDGLIHVHHLRPLSEIAEEYTIDPVADLRPVCPNCHAVLHSRKPAYTVLEVMDFIRIRAVGPSSLISVSTPRPIRSGS